MRLKLISTKGLSDINVGDHYSFSNLLEKRGLSQVQPSNSISIIIGSDYFFRFVTGPVMLMVSKPSLGGPYMVTYRCVIHPLMLLIRVLTLIIQFRNR